MLCVRGEEQGTYELPEDDLKRSKYVAPFLSILILTFYTNILLYMGAWGGVVVKALRY